VSGGPERPLSLAALTVLELAPPAMVEVAAQAGYSHVGLRLLPATPTERHFSLLADGALRRQTQARLRETGMQVLDVEILRLEPATQVDAFVPILELGAELGARHVLVAGNDPEFDRQAERLAALCDLCRPLGLLPHLEFMPWTAVPDLAAAMALVAATGRDDAAILVDAFHFDRSGSSLDQLARVPAQRLGYAQLCDVQGPRPSAMAEILRQAREERCFPGEGSADLLTLLRELPIGLPLSLEVPTRGLREQGVSPLQRARRALVGARRLLQQLQAHSGLVSSLARS